MISNIDDVCKLKISQIAYS